VACDQAVSPLESSCRRRSSVVTSLLEQASPTAKMRQKTNTLRRRRQLTTNPNTSEQHTPKRIVEDIIFIDYRVFRDTVWTITHIIYDINLRSGLRNKGGIVMKTREIMHELDGRRERLGMSKRALAENSQLSLPSVNRALANQTSPNIESVIEMADALGMELRLVPKVGEREFAEQRALKKGRRIAQLVGGTMAMEGEPVDESVKEAIAEEAMYNLLSRSRRRLWRV
jgi:DNA-binding phage protein